MSYIKQFENHIAEYFNSPIAIAVDCCTHAIELCLRHIKPSSVTSPRHTYPSIPMTYVKLGLDWKFVDDDWTGYYKIGGTSIIDAATLWQKDSYVPGTFMCLSFQFKKHLKLGRGGMILTDDKHSAEILSKMRYDGRTDDKPWAEQDISMFGYHYYMTPETAELGIQRFHEVKDMPAKLWSYTDYPDISKMKVFNAK